MPDAVTTRPRRALAPGLIAGAAVAAVIAAPAVSAAFAAGGTTDRAVFPREVAPYSWWTSPIGAGTIESATMVYQNGVGVEFLDAPQAVVLGSDGSTYRRLTAAEELTIPADQGDPAEMVLSADGTFVVLAGAGGRGAVDVVRLSDLDRRSIPVGEGVSAIPVSIDAAGESVLLLTSDAAMSPYEDYSFLLRGDLVRLELATGAMREYDVDDVHAAALSPDGTRIVADTARGLVVVDAASGAVSSIDLRRPDGVLDGDAWSPDGERFAILDTGELIVVDAAGPSPEVTTVALPAIEYGRAIGWSDDDTVLVHVADPTTDNGSQFAWVNVTTGAAESFAVYRPDFTGAALARPDVARDLVAVWQSEERTAGRGPLAAAISVGGALLAGALVGLIVWLFTPRRHAS